jgi:hypothetical protein
VEEILMEGAKVARIEAQKTLDLVKEAMGVDVFETHEIKTKVHIIKEEQEEMTSIGYWGKIQYFL